MKTIFTSSKILLILITSFYLLMSCTSDKNDETFIKKTEGRYLFNANEVIEIHFEDAVLYAKWRGKENIKPLKVSDSSFYMAEMNEKLIFLDNPTRIVLAEKTEHDGVPYVFEKLDKNEKTPSEYILAKEFDKALLAFQKIQNKDSLNPVIRSYNISRLARGYERKNDLETAIAIRKINTKLYPKNSSTYTSLGYAYWNKKDTLNAVASFKKALEINPENRNANRFLKKYKFDK